MGQEGWGGPGAQSGQPPRWQKGIQEVALSWVSPTLTPEYKKSFENDAQSSDNINFLKVQWSSRQLPTVRLLAGSELVGEGTGRGVKEHIWCMRVCVCVCVCCVVGLGMSKGEGICFIWEVWDQVTDSSIHS